MKNRVQSSAESLQVCGALNTLKLTTDLTKTNDSGASWPFSVHNSFELDRHLQNSHNR